MAEQIFTDSEIQTIATQCGLAVHMAGAASCAYSPGVQAVAWGDMKAFAQAVAEKAQTGALYGAANVLVVRLGADGQIDTRAPEVDAVMNALHDIDGGTPLEASDAHR